MNTITIYAKGFTADACGNEVSLSLEGVDTSQIVAELGTDEVLDSLDFATVMDYVIERRGEDDE